MTAETEFFRDIAEHPNDPTCRLIYADWLEERGDPRGEFIRLQCAREEMGRCPQAGPLALRERQLMHQNRREWIGPLHRSDMRVKFRGGLIDEVVVSTWAFNRLIDDLQQRAPVLRSLRLSDSSKGGIAEAIKRLANSPLAEHLRSLDLSGCGVTSAHVRRLAQATKLTRLTTLLLASNPICEDGIRLLVRAGNFAHLQVLDLNGIALRRKTMKMLMEPDRLLDLRLLVISGRHNPAAQRMLKSLQARFGDRLMVC